MKYPNIEAERARTGMTKADLCGKIGVAVQTYNNWQLGHNQMPVDKAIDISTVFGKTMDYLVKGGD